MNLKKDDFLIADLERAMAIELIAYIIKIYKIIKFYKCKREVKKIKKHCSRLKK